jgi:two-component system NarL family sensor kinase
MRDRSPSPEPSAAPAVVAPAVEGAERGALVDDFAVAGEIERRRIAESIHDDSIQVMAALSMRLQMLRRSLAEPDQIELLSEAEKAVQLSIARLRRLVFELHPPGLHGEGLSVALAIALDVAERDSAASFQLDDRLETQPEPAQAALLFRIAQEALTNAQEHAAASAVVVTLLERDGGHAVRIADDGRGFDSTLAEPGSDGYGFQSMRARARLAGGSLSVQSVASAGTTVEVWLPRFPPSEPQRVGTP